LHPASRILTYLVAALAIPGLSFFMLSIFALAAFPILFRLHRSPARLLWRTRWLLMILILGYAYGLPGEPLLPLLDAYSPSVEGVIHGGRQATGLLALLLWLDILVLAQSPDRLLGGLFQLARPFSPLGLDGGRLALRLGLTLEAIEGLERGRGNLIHLLDQGDVSALPSHVHVDTHPLRFIDLLVPSVLLAGMLGLWLSA
jgi:energy-coupling factor transporter transmembrane protein EcfT